MVLAAKDRDTYIQIHMIDFVLAVEQRIEEDVISCLKNGTQFDSHLSAPFLSWVPQAVLGTYVRPRVEPALISQLHF